MIFEKAEINDQHLLIKEVFKHKFTYLEGQVRTPLLNPGFNHKRLVFKEKGLLLEEQPLSNLGVNPVCTEGGSINLMCNHLFYSSLPYVLGGGSRIANLPVLSA